MTRQRHAKSARFWLHHNLEVFTDLCHTYFLELVINWLVKVWHNSVNTPHNLGAMKICIQLLGLGLLLFGQPQYLSAQTTNPDCQDIIRLKNGSTLRGQIQEVKNEGQTLTFQS